MSNPSDYIPSEEELIQRATELLPMLRNRADEIDAAGEVPEDIVQTFRDAGFFKIVQPRKWGGYEYSPLTFVRVLMELARGSGSAAWVMMVLGSHQYIVGIMSDEAGDTVWGEDNNILLSSSYAPAGKATPTEGGYLLNGTWPTSSGCAHAQWAIVGAMTENEFGEMEQMAFIAPRSGWSSLNDWDVFGLQGTGSNNIKLENAFVPDHLVTPLFRNTFDARSKVYRYPFPLLAMGIISASLIGFGQGAIDVFGEQIKGKKRTGSKDLLSEDPFVQAAVANAQAIVNNTRAKLEWCYLEAERFLFNDLEVPPSTMTQFVEISRTGEQIQEAVLTLYNVMSPSVAYRSNPMQRYLRDIMVGSAHPTQRFLTDHARTLGTTKLA
ncbi:hypothetical protein HBA55_12985 [Pseudomaricurvus alkylphenolicus]|uniref:acyl-CoA dehydrogenase family protein n=1 Tax=Pseudomaricurvus alkylphenolicus TaxID=1306991 RepID=UPI00142125EA|nr:acyl-CoA dehydrogenase family protein [Pseudomaricurvus alkylphenolicus]NIB40508.1 hypothetical protein [Pseudomaricurvus alkylphenolicus]